MVIPSFAVGRTQEMLYFIREIKEQGLVKGHDGLPGLCGQPAGQRGHRRLSPVRSRTALTRKRRAARAGRVNPLYFHGSEHLRHGGGFQGHQLRPRRPRSSSRPAACARRAASATTSSTTSGGRRALVLFVGYQAVGTLGQGDLRRRESRSSSSARRLPSTQRSRYPARHQRPCRQARADRLARPALRKSRSLVFVNHGEDAVMRILCPLSARPSTGIAQLRHTAARLMTWRPARR